MGAQGFYRSRPDLKWPDVLFLVSPVSLAARPWFPGWRKGAGHVFSMANVVLHPRSRGEVTLRSTNPKDAPRIRFNLLQAEADRATFRAMIRFATAMHPTSTCAMGIDAMAVVDAELRVRGVDCRRVVDASVRPTIPGGNTNAPVIMIAEKASNMILGRPPLPAAAI